MPNIVEQVHQRFIDKSMSDLFTTLDKGVAKYDLIRDNQAQAKKEERSIDYDALDRELSQFVNGFFANLKLKGFGHDETNG